MRLRSFLLTSALTFAPVVASATTISGLYVDGGAGYNLVQDQHVHANTPANGDAVSKFTVHHGTGFTGFGAVGWGFGNGLRVEAEGLYNFSHDNYTSEERTQEFVSSPVSTEYLKGKDLYVKPWDGTYRNLFTNYGGGTTPYYLTVQKVNEAPEWMTNQNYLINSENAYQDYLKSSDPAAYAGQASDTGVTWWQTFAPGMSPVSGANVPSYGATTAMTSCPDCYFVNILTQSQVNGLESSEQLSNNTNINPLGPYVAGGAVAEAVRAGYFPKGIYYIGDVYSNSSPQVASLPVSQKDGKLVYTATASQASNSQWVLVNTKGMSTLSTMNLPVNHEGTDESYGGFANVLYDFDLERLFGVKSIVTPFVGGGAGYLWQRYNRPNTMIAAITGTHGGFSWQGIAGVAFDTGISGLQITAQYRMIGQPGSFYNGSFNYGTEGGHANFDQRFNHQFIVGFRYAFHNQPVPIQAPPVPRPIVAAAPAPVPARSYLVFFDWNQYALTSRARQIVVEAAHATTYVHTTRINVNGYTDSSAAPGAAGQKYNYALSVKRARSVEAELIRNGVPASEIVIRGYGDTNPLVPTGPNTREPQNRRVEIILHA